ncbi:hypothetical protein RFI_28318 [Reticulomyxa filosa]|uniref:Uncharacterized protein n=1 Tax=Reticulomyxa filosa TaxID=46433 RepID=X6M5Z0_RETFI|nr:hypothetical protein RFI_28318 [Reticulomyxa filosa]|eukprot:ETO09066.1 hypothetical protein RFI_28318 [Reticulomyxa filosa]
MSLWKNSNFQNGELVFWVLLYIIMLWLLFASLLILYRQQSAPEQVKRLWKMRYVTLVCVLLQIGAFTGYFLQIPLIHEGFWQLWIPMFTFGFGYLSNKMIEAYLGTFIASTRPKNDSAYQPPPNHSPSDSCNNLETPAGNLSSSSSFLSPTPKQDSVHLLDNSFSNLITPKSSTSRLRGTISKIREELITPKFWRSIEVLWTLCILSNWCGTLVGWVFHQYKAQSALYALWKFIAFVMILLCIYVMNVVRKRSMRVFSRSRSSTSQSMSERLQTVKRIDYLLQKYCSLKQTKGIKRLRNLMICGGVVCVALIAGFCFEISVLCSRGQKGSDSYERSDIPFVLVYFPIWTFLHVIFLLYTWVPKPKKTTTSQKSQLISLIPIGQNKSNV